MYAKVIVDITHEKLDKIFEYRIPAELEERLHAGVEDVYKRQVMVDEPSVEDEISIMRGLKERYEVFHGVKLTDSALVAAATLSNRYISDRFLTDKAIDLVDEACALIKTELDLSLIHI